MPDEFDPAKLVRGESLIDWKPLSYTQRSGYRRLIQRNNVNTYDSFFNLGQQ